MEMPEGFKKWDSEASKVISEFFPYSEEEHIQMAGELEGKIFPLMKEMAEALEAYEEILNDAGMIPFRTGQEVRKKFYEWK